MEKISELELVQRYGTEAQIKKFETDGKLSGYNKKRVMERASQYCTVVPVGGGEYKLTNFKKVPLTPDYIKTTKGLYKYTCPLVMQHILDKSKDGKIILGMMSLAHSIDMVNRYYSIMNKDLHTTSDVLELQISLLYDYFDHVTGKINYYIRQTLDYLTKMNLVVYKKNYVFYWCKATPNGEGFNVSGKTTIATDEDMKIYTEALKYADEMTGVKTDRDRRFSSKSGEWDRYYHEKLGSCNVMNVFPIYEIYIVNEKQCRLYRNEFMSYDRLVMGLGKELRESVYDNAVKRIENPNMNFEEADYLMAYEFLSKICIGNFSIGKRLLAKMDEIEELNKDGKYKLIEVEEKNHGV